MGKSKHWASCHRMYSLADKNIPFNISKQQQEMQQQQQVQQQQMQQAQQMQQSQQQPPQPLDNISKIKSLVGPLRETLALTIKTAAQTLNQNNQIDSGSQKTPDIQIPRFDKNLEEFYSICDQIELHLKTSIKCLSQAESSNRYLNLPVMPNRSETIGMNENSLTFNMSSPVSFEIIVGTYEEYILGYIFTSNKQTIQQSFASHDHNASIRCLATNGNYLASGASDDRIIIYDLKARKEHCMLTQHESTITAVQFTNKHSHVMSASQDGALAIVRVGNWQLEKLWDKAHKEGMVLDIALHPSGKLALTLGSDGCIQTWDLVKGRKAYIINLKTKCEDPKSLEKISFSPDGTKFVLFGGNYIGIWSLEVGGAVQVITRENKVTCCIWQGNCHVLVGHEDGSMASISILTKEAEKEIKRAHNGRIKAADCSEGYIVTASSTGELKVWDSEFTELCKINSGCRVTCMKITKWLGFTIKEEPQNDAETKVFHAAKPVESKVIVEYEQSSEDEHAEPKKKARDQLKNPAISGKAIKKSKKNHVKRLKDKKVGERDAVTEKKSKRKGSSGVSSTASKMSKKMKKKKKKDVAD
ncbi:hypothetical protein YQE_11095, partial [Dendroctonus ponderosae]